MLYSFKKDHLFIVVTFSDREQVALHTTMSCMMRTDLLLMLFRPSLINWPIRRFLTFHHLTSDSIHYFIIYTTLAHILFLPRYARCTRSVSIGMLSLNWHFNNCLVFFLCTTHSFWLFFFVKMFCSSASLLCTSDCIQGPLLYGRNYIRWGLERWG